MSRTEYESKVAEGRLNSYNRQLSSNRQREDQSPFSSMLSSQVSPRSPTRSKEVKLQEKIQENSLHSSFFAMRRLSKNREKIIFHKAQVDRKAISQINNFTDESIRNNAINMLVTPADSYKLNRLLKIQNPHDTSFFGRASSTSKNAKTSFILNLQKKSRYKSNRQARPTNSIEHDTVSHYPDNESLMN